MKTLGDKPLKCVEIGSQPGASPRGQIELSGPEIDRIVVTVFEVTMGIGVRRVEAQFHEQEGQLTGAVYVSGQWEGTVLLQCSPSQACYFTGRFSSTESRESVDEEVRDLVGELTNMIAGNLKSGVLKSVHISLPSVVEGVIYKHSVRGRDLLIDRRAFSFAEEIFWVTFIELWK